MVVLYLVFRGTSMLCARVPPKHYRLSIQEKHFPLRKKKGAVSRRRKKSWAIKADSCPLPQGRTPTPGLRGPRPPPPASAPAPNREPPTGSACGALPVYILYRCLGKPTCEDKVELSLLHVHVGCENSPSNIRGSDLR